MENVKEEKVYTQAEADELVEQLKNVFTVVRILKADEVGGLSMLGDGSGGFCRCFDFWGKKSPCINCISARTLKDKTDRSKIEVADGEFFQVFCKYLNIEGKPHVLEVLKNISDLNIEPDDFRQLGDKLLNIEDTLYTDSLTGCHNRAYYDQRELKVLDNCGVALVDLDNLKDINDVYGHAAGDEALRAIGSALLKNVRSDDAVIRYGGDEFIMILPNISKESFYTKLEKIRKEIATTVLHEHNKARLSVSAGAVICNGSTLQASVKKADKLMYDAKKVKNRVIVDWLSNKDNVDKVDDKNKLFVLIVDDSDINRFLLKSMLEHKYKILEASDGKQAIEVIEDYRQNISLILLDIEMPNMGGFEYLNYLKKNEYLNDIPVIMISSDNNEDVILRSYELGAIDFITRPYNAKIVEQRVDNISRLFLKQRKFKTEIRKQLNKSDEENKMLSIIYSYAIKYRNEESGIHVLHVEQLTEAILNELIKISDYKFTDEQIKNIVTASGMHDIGKIGVRAAILNRHDLTAKEEEEYETHTLIGAEILESMTFYKDEELVKYAYNICRWHHERYDGSGFPDGLKGDQIPIEAQVVGIANAYDSYLAQYDFEQSAHDKVVDKIAKGKGTKFNPILVDCILNTKEALKTIYEIDNNSGGVFH